MLIVRAGDSKTPTLIQVKHSRPLFKGSERQCIHMELELLEAGWRYKSGDHVAIYPLNPEEEINRFAGFLGIADKLTTAIEVKNTDITGKTHPFLCPTTYLHALRHYMDICGSPSRQFVGTLAKYAKVAKALGAAEFLRLLGGNKEQYHKLVVENHINTGKLLQLAEKERKEGDSALTIPFAVAVEGLGRLQPRYYSISSSPRRYPNEVHITAVVLEKQVENQTFYGLTTSYLHNAMVRMNTSLGTRNDLSFTFKVENEILRVPAFIRTSNFRMPNNTSLPIIMIGPGTGVAPFRGFVQERVWQSEKDKEIGPTLLYYGCRRNDDDFLYREEWEEMFAQLKRKAQDQEMLVAFSREEGLPKTYVQHLMMEQQQRLWKFLEQGGYVYVCGDAKNMARAVNQTLVEIARMSGGMEADTAYTWVRELRNAGRYQEDVWS